MLNKKEILLFVTLMTINFLFYNNFIIGSLVALLQFSYLIFCFFTTKSLSRVFYWHIFFLLTSMETNIDLFNYSGAIYGYRTFQLPVIPISLSTLVTILLFILYIITNKRFFIPKKDIVFHFLVLTFVIAFSTGTIGVLFRNYDLHNFIVSLQLPIIYICIYMLLLVQKTKIPQFKNLLISALVGSVISSYTAGILGVQASYGIHVTLPMNQIMYFSPFLLWLSLFYKGKYRLFLFMVGIAACVNILVFNASGKGILFVIISIIIFLYKSSLKGKNLILFSPIIILFSIIGLQTIDSVVNLLSNNILFQAKLDQLIGFLNVSDWFYNLNNIPPSPRIRILQTINIVQSQKEYFVDLVIGNGFGGYFTDITNLFSNSGLNLANGAFSDKETASGMYTNTHASWNNVLLLNGLLGLIMWIGTIIFFLRNVIKSKQEPFFSFLSILFLSIFWNVFVIFSVYGLLCVFIALHSNEETKVSS